MGTHLYPLIKSQSVADFATGKQHNIPSPKDVEPFIHRSPKPEALNPQVKQTRSLKAWIEPWMPAQGHPTSCARLSGVSCKASCRSCRIAQTRHQGQNSTLSVSAIYFVCYFVCFVIVCVSVCVLSWFRRGPFCLPRGFWQPRHVQHARGCSRCSRGPG